MVSSVFTVSNLKQSKLTILDLLDGFSTSELVNTEQQKQPKRTKKALQTMIAGLLMKRKELVLLENFCFYTTM